MHLSTFTLEMTMRALAVSLVANVAFGRLSKRLWCNHGISIATKVAVYRAAILSSLL